MSGITNADPFGPFDPILTNPIQLAEGFALLLERAARFLDAVADRTKDPAWREIAVDMDQLGEKCRELEATLIDEARDAAEEPEWCRSLHPILRVWHRAHRRARRPQA